MTIKDLYDLAVENGFENLDMYVCVEDESGKCPFGLNSYMINVNENDVDIKVYV